MANGGPEQVGVEQAGIANVLSGYWLSVPPNQREYAWTEVEVQKLFQDFRKAISGHADNYFLGAIVTVPTEPGRLEIVDGQQRLATTAILLAAMREYLQRLGGRDDMIAQAIERVLYHIDTKIRDVVPRLQLNVDDNEYFRSTILAFNKNEAPAACRLPSHEKMLEAKRLAARHVEGLVSGFKDSDKGDELAAWLDFLLHKATVILLRVPSTANAYKMFETLNDRGLDTSQSDLIKNYLFGETGDRRSEAQVKWSQMRGVLGLLDEDEITLTFLRHAAISLYGHQRKDELFDNIERTVKGSRQAIQLLENLEAAAYDYVAILSHANDKWNEYSPSTRRAIETLEILSIKPARPLMLAIARMFSRKEADATFQAMISWQVRLLVSGRTRSEAVEKPLNDAAHAISNGTVSSLAQLFARLKPVIPGDALFREKFETLNVSKASLARYFLRILERAAKGEAEPWFIPNDDQTVITVEHVLPLNPLDNWPEWDSDMVRTYGRRLGNQALLQASSNSTLKSASFLDKRDVLGASPYNLTSLIGQEEQWLPKQVISRQKILADYALQAWPYPGNAKQSRGRSHDVNLDDPFD